MNKTAKATAFTCKGTIFVVLSDCLQVWKQYLSPRLFVSVYWTKKNQTRRYL